MKLLCFEYTLFRFIQDLDRPFWSLLSSLKLFILKLGIFARLYGGMEVFIRVFGTIDRDVRRNLFFIMSIVVS